MCLNTIGYGFQIAYEVGLHPFLNTTGSTDVIPRPFRVFRAVRLKNIFSQALVEPSRSNFLNISALLRCQPSSRIVTRILHSVDRTVDILTLHSGKRVIFHFSYEIRSS